MGEERLLNMHPRLTAGWLRHLRNINSSSCGCANCKMVMIHQVMRTVFLIVVSLALTAASDEPIFPGVLKNVEQAAEGDVLVLGSIKYLKNGEENKCGQLFGPDCRLIILPPYGRRAMVYGFRKSGDFAWSLPPGEYTILAFEWINQGKTVVPFRAVFSLPAGARAVYIGDLLLAVQKGRPLVGVHDGFEEALSKFEEKSLDQEQWLTKSIVTKEDVLGNWETIKYICSEDWHLACTKNQKGVSPLHPTDGKGFDVIDSLRPVFEWAPSSDGDVTYDFALFEDARYRKGGFAAEHTRGRILAYVQGLTKPTWQPETPLEPGQKYYWSVRLRKGEQVSNWSSYSYFNFFLVGFSSGYGQWFKFATPPG